MAVKSGKVMPEGEVSVDEAHSHKQGLPSQPVLHVDLEKNAGQECSWDKDFVNLCLDKPINKNGPHLCIDLPLLCQVVWPWLIVVPYHCCSWCLQQQTLRHLPR